VAVFPKGALYATASKASEAAASTPRQRHATGPEDIVSYGVGGSRPPCWAPCCRYEVAAYHSKYNNVQAQDLAPGCTPATCQALTVNSGKASGARSGRDAVGGADQRPRRLMSPFAAPADLPSMTWRAAERKPGATPSNLVPKRDGWAFHGPSSWRWVARLCPAWLVLGLSAF
jgi:hypothetical protein